MNDEFSKSNMMGDIVCKLIFLSKINEGEKINVKNMCITDNNIYANLCRHLFTTESKETTYDFIKSTIDNAFSILSLSKNQELTDTIIESISDAKIGIIKLQQTYFFDRMFVAKLETLLKMIDIRLKKPELSSQIDYFICEKRKSKE
jgi:hypothetical protein